MARVALKAVKATTAHVRLATYDHLQSLLFNAPLAAREARILQLVQVIGPRLAGLAGKEDTAVEMQADLFGQGVPEPDEIEITPDGVAIIPIRGTFTKRASLMASWSGLVSYEQITDLVTAMTAKPQVRGLVLAIDSPGGAVMGCAEAADLLAAIDKPIYVVADGHCASAAYWLAVRAADRFFVSPSSVVGSIGVYGVRLDATKADKDAGLAYTFIRSGDRKGDGNPHKPLAAEEKDDLQRQIDHAAAEFFAAVASARRGLDVATIARMEGATFVGADAVAQQLVDAVGTVPETVAALTSKLKADQRRALGLAAETTKEAAMAEKVEKKDEGKDAGAAPADTVVSIVDAHKMRDDAATQAADKAMQEVQEIIALCTHFGAAARANEFMAAKKTRAEVFAILQAEVVARDQAQATSNAHAGNDTPPAKKIDPAAYEALRNQAVTDAHARRSAPVIV